VACQTVAGAVSPEKLDEVRHVLLQVRTAGICPRPAKE